MNTIAQLIGAGFGDSPLAELAALPVLPAASPQARRRKKLWELPSRWHCPLVGSCAPMSELRKLARRAGFDDAAMTDYTLHTTVVGSCDSRTELAESIQRLLDRRHASAINRFARAKGEKAVLVLWREALAAGDDIAGALWAAWGHPDMTEAGGKTLYGDIHMLSHQVGAEARADLRRLTFLEQENRRLRDEAAALRLGLAEAQRQHDKTAAELRRQLADAEQRAALLAHRELELAEARRVTHDFDALRQRADALTRRVAVLDERNAVAGGRIQALEQELADRQAELAAAEGALETALGGCDGVAGSSGCGRSCPAEARLAGRCVLCIGGRTGLVHGYRRLVEAGGGRFLHHDGGLEESLHRLDAAVSCADAVVCQSGCVSHAAYWRLKEACKKLGKPCVFVKSPGIGSFARGLAALDRQDEGQMLAESEH